MQLPRVLVGFLVAPAVGPAAWVLYAHATNPQPDDVSLFLLLCYFAYPVTLLFGVPTFLAFRKLEISRWWQFALAGAAIGALSAFIITLQTDSLANIAIVGAISALAFWAIVASRNYHAHAA